MSPILVIGATGNIGREVVYRLIAAGVNVRAVSRHPPEARLPPQVDVVYGDLTVPETLDQSLSGIDTLFLVWTAPAAAIRGAFERIAGRARRIVYLSAPLTVPHPFFQKPQPNEGSIRHREIERIIRSSGLQWTFLRPGMFALNSRWFWGPQIRAGDIVRWPYLAAPTAPVDERDIAAVAVRALCEDRHRGAEYVLTGPESLTQFEQVSIIGRVLDRSLQIEEIPPDDAQRELSSVMGAPLANMLLAAWAGALGQPAWVTSTIEEVTGSPARTFRDWAVDHAADFRL